MSSRRATGDLARELVGLPDQTRLRAESVERGALDARRAVHDAAAEHDLEVDHVLARSCRARRDPSPLASVATMPPSVARLDGERLAAK